jgi:hypothetical protein
LVSGSLLLHQAAQPAKPRIQNSRTTSSPN